MSADLNAIAREAGAALRKLQALAEAAAGAPVTQAMEKLVPGLARFVNDAQALARIAGALGAFMPMLPTLIGVVEGLRSIHIQPMRPGAPEYLARERETGL